MSVLALKLVCGLGFLWIYQNSPNDSQLNKNEPDNFKGT